MKLLRSGDFIEHKHFGLCFVSKVMENETSFWALVIRPLCHEGMAKLRQWSGGYGNATLENKNRLVLQKIDKPIIPKLIFKVADDLYEVHQWIDDKLGVVNIIDAVEDKYKIVYSCVKVAEFATAEEAQAYVDRDLETQKLTIEAK